MAQLSTDTLAYAQIITKVQEFVLNYAQNKNNDPQEFDKQYKKLLSDIERSVGMPMTKIPFLNKGDIPSSEKMNRFNKDISSDLNNIMYQFDSLVANYVNSFNQITNEIEAEKNLISRIRSKISALEIYSNSAATNMTYVGDTFNNLDLIDTTKIRSGYLPDVTDGYACLGRRNIKKASGNINIINQNYNEEQTREVSYLDISNGLNGSYHLYFKDEDDNNPFLYEKDNALLRSNLLAMVDESPVTYFEYEALNVLGASERPDYEFQYGLSQSSTNQRYINWANFDASKPLKLTVEILTKNRSGEEINHISIIPFFGYDNIDIIKNIKISSIKIYNEKENTITPLVREDNPIYIGSDISYPSLSLKESYFYNKGVFRFPRIKATKVFITFEQSQFNEVDVKHAYWVPYETESSANSANESQTWRGQRRFSPVEVVADNSNYRAEDVSWNRDAVTPPIIGPERIKSSTSEVIPIKVKYWQQSTKTFSRIKVTSGATPSYPEATPSYSGAYYFSNDRINQENIPVKVFVSNVARAAKYESNSPYIQSIISSITDDQTSLHVILPEGETLNSYIASRRKPVTSVTAEDNEAVFASNSNGLSPGDKVYIKALSTSNQLVVNKGIYNVTAADASSFTVSITSGETELVALSSDSFFVKQEIEITEELIEKEDYTEPADAQRFKDLFLRRNFEYLKARRASIGIRDVFVGLESYSDISEIVSKPFYIYGNLELLSLQVEDYIPVERNSDGETIGESRIDYFISVDGGLRWIEISPQERAFAGRPEVIALNQNLSDIATLPQIAYFNSPEVPQNINSVIFRAILRKDRNIKSTPIIYSYKLGMKVT
jgi:hypothetical protein